MPGFPSESVNGRGHASGPATRAAVLACVMCLFAVLSACGKSDEELAAERRDKNSKQFYGDSETPGTKAYESKQAAIQRQAAADEERKLEASTPPMKLPTHPTTIEVLAKPRAEVRALLPTGYTKEADLDRAVVDGAAIAIRYATGRAVEFEIRPASYLARRDETELRQWLGVAYGASEINRRPVDVVASAVGIVVTDLMCEPKERETREQWMTRAVNADDGSPYDNGLRMSGPCGQTLEGKGFSCDEPTVRTAEGGRGGWLDDALRRGFKNYVCIDVSSGERREYSLKRLVHGT